MKFKTKHTDSTTTIPTCSKKHNERSNNSNTKIPCDHTLVPK